MTILLIAVTIFVIDYILIQFSTSKLNDDDDF